MGGAISYAASPSSMIQAAICGNKPDAKGGGADYLHLPCPVKYEEITREAFSKCLHPGDSKKMPVFIVKRLICCMRRLAHTF